MREKIAIQLAVLAEVAFHDHVECGAGYDLNLLVHILSLIYSKLGF